MKQLITKELARDKYGVSINQPGDNNIYWLIETDKEIRIIDDTDSTRYYEDKSETYGVDWDGEKYIMTRMEEIEFPKTANDVLYRPITGDMIRGWFFMLPKTEEFKRLDSDIIEYVDKLMKEHISFRMIPCYKDEYLANIDRTIPPYQEEK